MIRLLARSLRPLGLLSLLLTAGCGSKLNYNHQVEGIALFDGAPLAGALVQFIPDVEDGGTALSSSGVTDAKGHYRLTYGKDKPGAVLGKHRVVILQGRAGSGREDRDDQSGRASLSGKPIPPMYASAAQTPLKVEITPDKHTYDLTLTR